MRQAEILNNTYVARWHSIGEAGVLIAGQYVSCDFELIDEMLDCTEYRINGRAECMSDRLKSYVHDLIGDLI